MSTTVKATGRPSPHAGKKIKSLFPKAEERTAALDALRGDSAKVKLGKVLEFNGKKVEAVLGIAVTVGDKTSKITSADLTKAVEKKLIELV